MFHYTSLYEQLFPLFFPLEILSINAKERNDIDLFKERVKKNIYSVNEKLLLSLSENIKNKNEISFRPYL